MRQIEFNHFKVLIELNGQVDYTKHVPFPIKWNNLLDEQLDEANITVIRSKIPNFKLNSRVEISRWNDATPTDIHTTGYIVTNDKANELPVGSGLYTHTISLIEETKQLEGYVCRTQGYVNSLGRDYGNAGYDVSYTYARPPQPISYPPALNIHTPISTGKIFPTIRQMFPTVGVYGGINRISIQSSTWEFTGAEDTSSTALAYVNGVDSVLTVPDISNSNYQLVYQVSNDLGNAQMFVYNISIYSNLDPLPKWNARTVIERALAIAEPLRKGDTPRFKLNADQAAEFEKIETPEFQFTQSTLREVLQGVGAYVHGEPRLVGDTIYYDMYGSDEMSDIKYSHYAALSTSQSIDDFATCLDSSVDNLVNSLETPYASMTEPYIGGYKTVRTEKTFARIEEGNLFIETKYPVYLIKKVMCGYTASSDPVDITPYIFESSEYARMSSYVETYPYSKAYALYYSQGDKNIQGLTFKVNDATGGVFRNYAVLNILRAVTGNNGLNLSDYTQLAFQVEYIPIFPARVQQSKQYIGDFIRPFTKVYNQGQNVVETQYFGENMKGLMARVGNIEKTYTYVFYGLPEIPKAGLLFDDDYYISAVAVEYQPTTTKISLGLSQDFNRRSQYIGINSTKRFYEVSERQAFDSQLNYRDYAVIGDQTDGGDTLYDISDIARTFDQSGSRMPASLVLAQGEDANGGELAKIALPVQSIALGNSAVLTTKYEDNYSAGNDSVYQGSGNVTGQFTMAVAYGDFYGNMEYLNLDYYEQGTLPQSMVQQTDIGTSLPSGEKVNGVGERYLTTGAKPLWVKKGSTEILSVTYQVDFVTNRRNIIIGSGLAKNCVFISGTQSGHSAALYVLPKRLNKFKLVADLAGATLVKDYASGGFSVSGNSISFDPVASPVSGQAWVMVDKSTGEVLIGCNKEITPESADILDGLYITSKHQLF